MSEEVTHGEVSSKYCRARCFAAARRRQLGVKGVKYSKAEAESMRAAISKVVEEGQREFEVSDWS